MANYTQVGYGSQGSDVTELQKLLNQNGYTLDVDGIFGDKTQAAVKDYQKKNNLAVDGIVGTNTWGALTAAQTGQTATTDPTNTATTQGTTTTQNAPTTQGSNNGGSTSQYAPYQASDIVKQADAMVQQYLAQKPGEYQSQWQGKLDEIMNNILNREKFSYDMNADALYQQYKNQYMMQGQQAMMDTMGQAAAMTGGYGNSYAQSVGQQTYNGYLQQLNDVMPELYQMALNNYQMEGDEMAQQYAMIGAREDQDYGRYQDKVSEYYAELERLTEDARYQSETDYEKYLQDLGFAYQQDRDKVADEKWKAEMDEDTRRYDQEWEQKYGSSNKSDDTSTGNPQPVGYENMGLTENQIKMVQLSLGITADGKWGPESVAAAGNLNAKEAYDAWNQGKLGEPVGWVAGYTGNQNGQQTSFTGTTYSEAVAYMKNNGVSPAQASNILTESEWRRAKASNSPRYGANEFDSYEEYLEYAVDANILAYGK